MAEVLLNQEQIKEIIPHRDPFLLIVEVLERKWASVWWHGNISRQTTFVQWDTSRKSR